MPRALNPCLACLNCPLPDCDESSLGCPLRRLWSAAQHKIRSGRKDEITADERAARAAFYAIWKLDREAMISEACR